MAMKRYKRLRLRDAVKEAIIGNYLGGVQHG
jgi:hypothetical protein